MTRKLIALTLAAALALPAAGAFASGDDYAPVDPAAAEQVRSVLTAAGYEVRQIKMEDGMYEAYAIKDGKRMEVLVNAQMEIVGTDNDD